MQCAPFPVDADNHELYGPALPNDSPFVLRLGHVCVHSNPLGRYVGCHDRIARTYLAQHFQRSVPLLARFCRAVDQTVNVPPKEHCTAPQEGAFLLAKKINRRIRSQCTGMVWPKAEVIESSIKSRRTVVPRPVLITVDCIDTDRCELQMRTLPTPDSAVLHARTVPDYSCTAGPGISSSHI